MIFFCVLIILVFVAQIAEFFIPPLIGCRTRVFTSSGDCFLRRDGATFSALLVLAFWAGFLLDALTAQVIGGRVEISFGWSILLYAVLAGIMHGLQAAFYSWTLGSSLYNERPLHVGLVLGQYLMISFRRGSIVFFA